MHEVGIATAQKDVQIFTKINISAMNTSVASPNEAASFTPRKPEQSTVIHVSYCLLLDIVFFSAEKKNKRHHSVIHFLQ